VGGGGGLLLLCCLALAVGAFVFRRFGRRLVEEL
jgi:hypothetical protein